MDTAVVGGSCVALSPIRDELDPHQVSTFCGWEGSLTGGMKMGTLLYMAPSSDWIRHDAPKLQQSPLSPAHYKREWRAGFT